MTNGLDSAVAAHVHRLEYTNCADDAPVVLYTVGGGGHSWPGGRPIAEWWVGPTSHEVDATVDVDVLSCASPDEEVTSRSGRFRAMNTEAERERRRCVAICRRWAELWRKAFARHPMAALEEARGRANEATYLADLLESGDGLTETNVVSGDDADA
ncbi:MAG: hypothetical protein ACM3NW_01295 [Syntrophomonadaceae bacterium]